MKGGEPVDDAELLERIQQGERQYLTPLIERHYEPIRRYCYWKTRCAEASQDLTQETFYRFVRSIDTYVHAGKCRAYLYTVARRLCSDYFRDKPPVSAEPIEESAWGIAASAEETAEQRQLAEEMNRLLHLLPPEQQEVLALRFACGLKFREIAAVTGSSVYTVQYRTSRGLAALKKQLDKEARDEKPATEPPRTHSSASSCTRS